MTILGGACAFWRLPAADRGLLVRVGLLVGFIRLVLWARPWPSVVRIVRALPPRLSSRRTRLFSAERLAWAVGHSSRFVPNATCLTQALALQCALTAAGVPNSIEIGVAKGPGGRFQSHAWVEHDGLPLLDPTAETIRYSRLLTLQAPTLQVGTPSLPSRGCGRHAT